MNHARASTYAPRGEEVSMDDLEFDRAFIQAAFEQLARLGRGAGHRAGAGPSLRYDDAPVRCLAGASRRRSGIVAGLAGGAGARPSALGRESHQHALAFGCGGCRNARPARPPAGKSLARRLALCRARLDARPYRRSLENHGGAGSRAGPRGTSRTLVARRRGGIGWLGTAFRRTARLALGRCSGTDGTLRRKAPHPRPLVLSDRFVLFMELSPSCALI